MDPTRRMTWLPASGEILPAAARAAAAALSAALIFGCVSMPREIRYEEQSQVAVDVAPQTRVVVENARGTVRLEAGGSPKLHVEARKRAAGLSLTDARAMAREVTVEVLREGQDLRVVVNYPERVASSTRVYGWGRQWRHRRVDVDLSIMLPAALPTKVETQSGDLTIDGTSGAAEFWTTSGDATIERHTGALAVHSTSGDLTVERLDGPLEMNTTSGDLQADAISGSVTFTSTSGDLKAAEVGGDLSVESVSGDVDVDRVHGTSQVSTTSGDVTLGDTSGRVDVRTASGDVTASVRQALERVSVETTSGDVEVSLPDPPLGRLEVVTASGEVTAQVPMALEQATRRRLVGVMGAGPATVAIHTSSGDVQVNLASDR
jgi:DUF4097 and DUF4098 domain-containing protein YvlB